MPSSIQLRILAYTAVLAMYITNMHYMNSFAKRQSGTQDQRLLAFKGLGNRFFTTWTFMLQMTYICLSLVCDVLKNFSRKTHVLLKYMDQFREIMFASFVWPCTLVVSTVFWSIFNYDRSLIFPEYLDQVLPTISNHVLHTFIVPVVLFEVVFRPRIEPATHKWNLLLMTSYVSVYFCVLIFTYIERGVWMYPIFGQLYGTMYFVLSIAILYSLFIIFYSIQWPITKKIHGTPVKKSRNDFKKTV